MSDVKYPIKGSCQCGGVSYDLLEPPIMVFACHCKECQKLSTSAFSISAVVDSSAVKFQGEMSDWQRTADSGNINAAKFCPGCGNRIYHFNPDEPDKLKLKASNMNDTSDLIPTVHVWVSRKQDWYQIPADVKVFDRQPE